MNTQINRFLKQLNPTTKLWCIFSLGCGCLLYPSPFLGYGLTCLLLLGAIGIGTGRAAVKLLLSFGIPVTAILVFIQGFFSPRNKTLLVDLGYAQLGLEGTLYALKISATLLVFLLAFYLYQRTTSNAETVTALTQAGINVKIGYLVLASLNVVPQMQHKLNVIREAQEARGVELNGHLFRRIKAFFPLIGPVVLTSLTDAQERGMTLETRGFNLKGVRPTSLIVVKKRRRDTALKTGAFLFVLLMLYGRLSS